ncbi:MAG TPA: DUF4268 domain-containing protein [Candidatus Paceibacterota bacterium]|jgi:hypothetical protein|nr:DUF4268 domain-containing protein [Candidatus Paceibacterota bacterium]
MSLGKLKKIELREGWRHEANDFTKWLALEENLKLLSDEIGFDIKLIQTEAKVGSFNVDILAEEETTGHKIIIENQLEVTNHDHLGKIVTYASGYDARIIVWVVKDVREEHRQAIDWLNENTNEEIGFYLLKIELWQIADSPLAPKFEIISKPNDWAKAVKSSVDSAELTDTKIKQLQFWDAFKSYAKQANTTLRFQKSYPQHWTNISIGNSDSHIALTVNSRDEVFTCDIYIPDNKELFQHFFENKDKIEMDLSETLEWMELPNKKASRIRLSYPGNFEDESKWEIYFSWLLAVAEKFKVVFPKYID